MRGKDNKGPRPVHRAASDARARGLFDRHRFTGDHAFINIGCTADHIAIHRNSFTRPGMQHIAGDNLV